MIGKLGVGAVLVLVAGLGIRQQATAPGDRLYGRVTTSGGEVFEGFIRWDRNEGSWADLLNGDKEIPWRNYRDQERYDEHARRPRERSIEFLGLRVSWSEDEGDIPGSASSGLRFGHVRSILVLDEDRALVTLKSGDEVELEGGSTDLGEDIRGIVIDDPQRGEIELSWDDLDEVEFSQAPRGVSPSGGARLYGTLTTRDGEQFTGYVSWDVDEILTTDILDGKERGRTRRIPFARIAAIERMGPSGARVVLANGEEVVLRGTNDVNDDNRGIAVSDPALGQVRVGWDEFDGVTFYAAPDTAGYEAFDGGHPLYGTVLTEGGDAYTGAVRWDNDEEYTWEILDGRDHDIDFDVEFGQISRIAKISSRRAEITLLDGRRFELGGSNDVDRDNKGIFVTLDDGDTVMVDWYDFREVTFQR